MCVCPPCSDDAMLAGSSSCASGGAITAAAREAALLACECMACHAHAASRMCAAAQAAWAEYEHSACLPLQPNAMPPPPPPVR